MLASGESRKEVIRPDFNRAIMIDFHGAKITSDVGFHLMREIDDRFKIIAPMGDCLEDLRSPAHTKHSLVQMIRQRVYQIAAGYEDCNDADFLRIEPYYDGALPFGDLFNLITSLAPMKLWGISQPHCLPSGIPIWADAIFTRK
ncbi:MAG: transposase [Desulfobaccales bacterium]|nr:transposase [Desulfobaccales bacterium]